MVSVRFYKISLNFLIQSDYYLSEISEMRTVVLIWIMYSVTQHNHLDKFMSWASYRNLDHPKIPAVFLNSRYCMNCCKKYILMQYLNEKTN